MHKAKIGILSVLFLLLVTVSFAAQPDYVYVSANNVRIRDAASTAGAVVATLPIGTWGKVLETSDNAENLLGKTAHWYKISINNDLEGWIFGGLTLAATADERFSAALSVINSQIDTDKKPLHDLMQTLEFTESVKEMASHSLEKADLDLAFFILLDHIYWTFKVVGKYGEISHKAVNDYKNICYYHENAAQYFVKPEAFWELSEEYADIPEAAEKIAWQAARQILPGETEGEPEAVISVFKATYGRYLESYPEGKYVTQVLEDVVREINYIYENLSDYEKSLDKKSFKKLLVWLEDLVALTPASEARTKLTAGIKKLFDRL